MKKILKNTLLILALASTLFLLTGCGEEKNDSDKKESTSVKEEEKVESKVEFSMGEWNNNVYENEFLGLKFNLPEGWTYLTDAELEENNKELGELNGVYYVNAKNSSTGDNIIIMTEKTATGLTTEYYLEQVKTQLESVDSMSYEIGEISEETVAGRKYKTVTAVASVSGIKVEQKYYVYKMDEYFVSIISTTLNGQSAINNMMEAFE